MTNTTESVQAAARLAVRHLRTAAYRLREHGDPEADELLATADALADDLDPVDDTRT